MAWLYLIIAGFFEIIWATGLKYTIGFTRIIPSIGTLLAMIISVYLLSLATRSLPIGTSYPIWTGIGATGTVIAGIILFNEPKDLTRMLFIGLIVVGIIGLRYTSTN